MEWTKSASTYSSRNEARTANSMLATMFVFVSSVFGETAASFSLFMSHLIALFTVIFRIRQMEQVNTSDSEGSFQLRTLRVVTRWAFPIAPSSCGCAYLRNQRGSKWLRVTVQLQSASHCMFDRPECCPIRVPAVAADRKRIGRA